MNDTTITPGQVYNVLRSGAVAEYLNEELRYLMANLTGLPVPMDVEKGFNTHLQAQINNMAMYYDSGDDSSWTPEDSFMEMLVVAMVKRGLDLSGVCSDVNCENPTARFKTYEYNPFEVVVGGLA